MTLFCSLMLIAFACVISNYYGIKTSCFQNARAQHWNRSETWSGTIDCKALRNLRKFRNEGAI